MSLGAVLSDPAWQWVISSFGAILMAISTLVYIFYIIPNGKRHDDNENLIKQLANKLDLETTNLWDSNREVERLMGKTQTVNDGRYAFRDDLNAVKINLKDELVDVKQLIERNHMQATNNAKESRDSMDRMNGMLFQLVQSGKNRND